MSTFFQNNFFFNFSPRKAHFWTKFMLRIHSPRDASAPNEICTKYLPEEINKKDIKVTIKKTLQITALDGLRTYVETDKP